MFDLELAITKWRKLLRKNSALEDGYIEELESHLREEIDEGRGLSEEEAFNAAVEKIGVAENVGEEYYKSDTTHISKRPPWQTNPYIPALLYNYFKLAFRNLRRNAAYSLINIIGLSISLVVFSVFALGFGVHLHADRFHKNADRIFGVIKVEEAQNKELNHSAFLPAPLLPAMKSEFPEIKEGTRVSSPGRLKIEVNNSIFFENNALLVDKNFFEIFSFDLIEGIEKTALTSPQSIVITKNIAEKYFGEDNPVGKYLLINNKDKFTVKGVMENLSRFSSLQFEFLIPMEASKSLGMDLDKWNSSRYSTFLLLNKVDDKATLESKLAAFRLKYWNPDKDPVNNIYLLPLTDFRLKSDHIESMMRATQLSTLVILMSFGILLLIVTSFNFVNLSIARFMTRVKEIGLRKVLGAKRVQLIKQFMTESILIAFIAFLLTILLYEFASPILMSYMETFKLVGAIARQSNSIFNYPVLLLYIFAAAMFSGILSGIFPAFYVSGVNPVNSLKGNLAIGKSKRRGTKILIVGQFFISTMILVFTGLFDKQLDYWVHNANFGYSRDNIAIIELPDETLDKRQILMDDISSLPGVNMVSASQNIPGLWSSEKMAKLIGKDDSDSYEMYAYGVTEKFTEILSIPLVEGRSFDIQYSDINNIIINKAAALKFGLDNPIGSVIVLDSVEHTIVGVTENFAFNDIGFDLPPAIFYLEKNDINFMLVKLSKEYDTLARDHFTQTWSSLFPNLPLESYGMNKFFDEVMSVGSSILGIFKMIGYLSVIFSYIGLIGLLSFMIARRTKEIGIRKVLGAPVSKIIKNIVNEYLRLVVIANVIALPLIYYLWNKIVQSGLLFMQPFNFTYTLITLAVTIIIAASIIISRVYKSVKINPSESLRYE